MRKYLLPKDGTFYKANLHMHTTVSDGNMTPEETKKAFMEKGYSIVAYTDHEVMVPHVDLEEEGFLPITSTEINIDFGRAKGLNYSYEITYHLNLYSRDKYKTDFAAFGANRPWGNARGYILPEQADRQAVRRYCVDFVNDTIAKSKQEGMIVSYNHPVWSMQSYSDYIGLKGLWGVEWHNTGCVHAAYDDTIQPIDDLVRVGENVIPLATDDAHSIAHCFYGWSMIKASSLTYDEVFAAMERGDMYSSTGPEIKQLYIEDGILHVETSDAARVAVTTERRWTKCTYAKDDQPITSVDFDLNDYINTTLPGEYKSKPYFRITVTDKYGKLAYTRPYKLSELYNTTWVEKE